MWNSLRKCRNKIKLGCDSKSAFEKGTLHIKGQQLWWQDSLQLTNHTGTNETSDKIKLH